METMVKNLSIDKLWDLPDIAPPVGFNSGFRETFETNTKK